MGANLAWDALQRDATDRLIASVQQHGNAVACAPTGYGKTKTATMLLKDWILPSKMTWEFMTNRRSLLDQSYDVFDNMEGVEFGVRGAGYEPRLAKPGQLTIIQTDGKAVKEGRWAPHQSDVLIIDEIHNTISSRYVQERVQAQRERGFPVIGLSATPIPGLGVFFSHLEVLCSISELRKVGGILYAECHTPSEVDLRDVKKLSLGEQKEELSKRFTQQQVVGNIMEHWHRLNPKGHPTIQFNPCVESSKWFCDQWNAAGIRAAHIDGSNIYFSQRDAAGERIYWPSNRRTRKELKKMAREGVIKVTNNRFVMREGVDWPFLYHAIFATKMGVVPWIQSCGRVLRSCSKLPWMDHVIVQDHGGNLYAPGLGSPNADREWSLDDTPKSIVTAAKNRQAHGEEHAPVMCPNCLRPIRWEVWVNRKGSCPHCAKQFMEGNNRVVFQTDGSLKSVKMDAIKIRVKTEHTEAQNAWNKMFFPSKNTKSDRSSTFWQLRARFHKQFPHLFVQSDGRKVGDGPKVSGIVDRRTGDFFPVDNMPHPGSAVWSIRANQSKFSQLQKGMVPRAEANNVFPGGSGDSVPGDQSGTASPAKDRQKGDGGNSVRGGAKPVRHSGGLFGDV